ncbi:hypothetical protein K439DRAFT_308606 [Ramaria rubella]|nr:hypothetical protein K439DRAFT_308606 [Ramaria rubella]
MMDSHHLTLDIRAHSLRWRVRHSFRNILTLAPASDSFLTMQSVQIPWPSSVSRGFTIKRHQRPMKVEIVLDPARAQPAPTLSQRVGPAPAAAAKGAANAQGVTRGKKGGKGRGGKKRGPPRPPKSAEDLDAEMADYSGSTNTAAAVAT